MNQPLVAADVRRRTAGTVPSLTAPLPFVTSGAATVEGQRSAYSLLLAPVDTYTGLTVTTFLTADSSSNTLTSLFTQKLTLSNPTGSSIDAVRVFIANLLRFESLIGRTYFIQYRDDVEDDWRTVLHEIVGNGTLINWLDSGAPKTDSFPVAGERTYRVLLAP